MEPVAREVISSINRVFVSLFSLRFKVRLKVHEAYVLGRSVVEQSGGDAAERRRRDKGGGVAWQVAGVEEAGGAQARWRASLTIVVEPSRSSEVMREEAEWRRGASCLR